jgi:ribosomal 50S subunit-recycling heat shock protein
MPQKVTVKQDYHNSRFDKWFKVVIKDLPQSLIQKILRLNKVKINRKKVKSS